MTSIQAIYIRGHEERASPKPHTVFRIEIQANVQSWQMWRRYSEFVDLNTELTKSARPPPALLPPKHSFSFIRSHTNEKLLEERREGLERYLRAIISSKEDVWRESFPFKDFLGIPVGRQGAIAAPNQFTTASWLDEHTELQSRVRAVRADLNKRDALSDRGDVAGSHKANLGAKTKLAGISARIDTLERGLKELAMGGLSEGELQRRSDMVARLWDDHEKLTRMVTVATQVSRDPGFGTTSSVSTDREALVRPSTANKPFTRVFGSSAPVESEQTRPLDNHGLMGLQQTQVEQQDEQLAQITAILQRQKHLGLAIGNEITEQITILDDLNNQVDIVGGKLTKANRQMNRLG